MADLYTIIYESHDDIPETECGNFFHGKALFRVFESTPRMKPYMVCVSAEGKKVVSCLLGVVRSRGALFPPFLCNHCLVLGEGEYFYHDYSREKLFKMMLATSILLILLFCHAAHSIKLIYQFITFLGILLKIWWITQVQK